MMQLIDQLSELLPIVPPIEVAQIQKDETHSRVIVYLSVSESNTPINHRIHSY